MGLAEVIESLDGLIEEMERDGPISRNLLRAREFFDLARSIEGLPPLPPLEVPGVEPPNGERVKVEYHYEGGRWWADSPDLPTLFAAGGSLEDTRDRAREVVDREVGAEALIVPSMAARS